MLPDTTVQRSFTLDRPGGSIVTFILPDPSEPSTFDKSITTIVLPSGSTWTPNAHWHEHYVEHIRVTRGRARVILDGIPRVVGPEDGFVTIDKGVVHEFMRADCGLLPTEVEDGDVIVQEWTEPADGFKEVFFRQLFAILNNQDKLSSVTMALQVILTLNYCDNWNVVTSGPLSWYATHTMFAVGTFAARILGLKPWYAESLPERLHSVARRGGERYGKSKEI